MAELERWWVWALGRPRRWWCPDCQCSLMLDPHGGERRMCGWPCSTLGFAGLAPRVQSRASYFSRHGRPYRLRSARRRDTLIRHEGPVAQGDFR